MQITLMRPCPPAFVRPLERSPLGRGALAGGAALLMAGLLATALLAAAPSALAKPKARMAQDPVGNRTLSGATLWACQANPAGAGCVTPVLAAIDSARASEGVRPLHLPARFTALSIPAQLLVLASAERADRGLRTVIGLTRNLDQSALAGARGNTDPEPKPFYGTTYGSNWAGGMRSSLAVDFLWMYDDGAGSPNVDCRAAGQPGCWGHRRNILYPYQAPLVMGAAAYRSSLTEVFVGGDARTRPGQPDAPLLRLRG